MLSRSVNFVQRPKFNLFVTSLATLPRIYQPLERKKKRTDKKKKLTCPISRRQLSSACHAGELCYVTGHVDASAESNIPREKSTAHAPRTRPTPPMAARRRRTLNRKEENPSIRPRSKETGLPVLDDMLVHR